MAHSVETTLEFFSLETLTKINIPLKWNRPGKQNKTQLLELSKPEEAQKRNKYHENVREDLFFQF